AKQGHGAVPAQGGGPVYDDRASGRRKPVPAQVRHARALGRGREDPRAALSLGAGPDRQLRAADRARRGLAAADPWRRRDAQ
nr:hypothetical protein [Tanacetum cinerariifolium]